MNLQLASINPVNGIAVIALPNYSLRMSGLLAAVFRPQVKTLDQSVQAYNTRYENFNPQLLERLPGLITIPDVTPGVTMPVHDSLQFNLDYGITDEQTQDFLDECAAHGLPVELFRHKYYCTLSQLISKY